MPHFCMIDHAEDADYIVFASRDAHGEIIEHTRWMVPGSQLEADSDE